MEPVRKEERNDRICTALSPFLDSNRDASSSDTFIPDFLLLPSTLDFLSQIRVAMFAKYKEVNDSSPPKSQTTTSINKAK